MTQRRAGITRWNGSSSTLKASQVTLVLSAMSCGSGTPCTGLRGTLALGDPAMETPKYPGLWHPGTRPTRFGATQTQARKTSAGGVDEDGHGGGPPFHVLSHVPRQKTENGKSSTAQPARTSTLTTPLRAASTRTSPSTSSSSANHSSMSSILSHPASSLPSWPSLSSTCPLTVSEPHGTHTRHRSHPMGHLHVPHLHQVLGHGDTPMPSTGTS